MAKSRSLYIRLLVETADRAERVRDRRGEAATKVGGKPPQLTDVIREAVEIGLPHLEMAGGPGVVL